MTFRFAAASVLALSSLVSAHTLSAQGASGQDARGQEMLPTQVILLTQSKSAATPKVAPAAVRLEVDGHAQQISSLAPLNPSDVQIALLIDDGLRTSVGRQLSDIKTFIQQLPPATEIFVGYMQNGRVVAGQPFTRDHAAAAATLRLPLGSPGLSASPYFCLSDFAKKWPSEPTTYSAPTPGRPARKARFVLMLTNGVDPYNGSVSPMNQDSPYVQAAITDSQRAGLSVSSIYYGDAGIRGGAASFSGQSYLSQVADATGGISFFQGTGNPVSLLPYLKQFQTSIERSYVATFTAPAGKDLVRVSFKTSVSGLKLHAPQLVHPGRSLTAAS